MQRDCATGAVIGSPVAILGLGLVAETNVSRASGS